MAYAAGSNKLALFLPEPYDVLWSLVVLVVLAAFFYKFVMPKFQEASKIIGEARQRAEKDAAKIISEAQHSIEAQHKHAMSSLQGEVSVLAAALAGKILASKLDDDTVSSKIIDHVIDEVGDTKNSDQSK